MPGLGKVQSSCKPFLLGVLVPAQPTLMCSLHQGCRMLFVFGVMGVWTSPAAAVCLGLGCSLSRGPPVLGFGGGCLPLPPSRMWGIVPSCPHTAAVWAVWGCPLDVLGLLPSLCCFKQTERCKPDVFLYVQQTLINTPPTPPLPVPQ